MIDIRYKNKARRFYRASRRFKKEYRKEIRMLVVLTFSFTIAFTWRQTLFDISQSFVQWVTHIQSTGASSIATSIFITLISVGFIWLSSYMIKESPDEKY